MKKIIAILLMLIMVSGCTTKYTNAITSYYAQDSIKAKATSDRIMNFIAGSYKTCHRKHKPKFTDKVEDLINVDGISKYKKFSAAMWFWNAAKWTYVTPYRIISYIPLLNIITDIFFGRPSKNWYWSWGFDEKYDENKVREKLKKDLQASIPSVNCVALYGSYFFKYYQITKDEFVIHATAHKSSTSGTAAISEALFDEYILTVALTLGEAKGFTYMAFGNITESENRNKQADTVTTTQKNSGRQTQHVYHTQYGSIGFGDNSGGSSSTTKVTRGKDSINRNLKHPIKFYKSKPAVAKFYDLKLLKKSLGVGEITVLGL